MKPRHRRYSPNGRQQPIRQDLVHTMAFSVEALTILQASFQTMDEIFKRQMHIPNPRLPFALETFKRVKQKVFDMLHAPGELCTLDGNEVLIIRACLQIYTIDLLCMKATPEREHKISLCGQVAALLPKETPRPIRLHD